MQLVVGQVVASRAGRDVARWYVVVGISEERVLLANGAKWTLARPKPKNARHVAPTKTVLAPCALETDQLIQEALVAYASSRKADEQGG